MPGVLAGLLPNRTQVIHWGTASFCPLLVSGIARLCALPARYKGTRVPLLGQKTTPPSSPLPPQLLPPHISVPEPTSTSTNMSYSAPSRTISLWGQTTDHQSISRSLRLLAGNRPTKGPMHAYPRHYNPRYVPYPFEPIRLPPTPLLRNIDLPDLGDDELLLPSPHILAASVPHTAALFNNVPPPFQPVDGCSRVHRPSARVNPRTPRPLPATPAGRSEPPVHVHDGMNATPAPILDRALALPAHPSSCPLFDWDIMLDPFKALEKPQNVTFLQTTDLRRWAAIRAAPGSIPTPLTSMVFIFKDVPGVEITVERSAIPPLLPPSRWPEDPRTVILYDVFGQLYRELREPLTRRELAALSEEERARLRQAADARIGNEFECPADVWGHARERERERSRPTSVHSAYADGYAHADPWHERVPLRRVDRLGRRRRFLGIRPAQPWEVPAGRKFGDVFVVELGMC